MKCDSKSTPSKKSGGWGEGSVGKELESSVHTEKSRVEEGCMCSFNPSTQVQRQGDSQGQVLDWLNGK